MTMVVVEAFRRDFGNGRASISYIKRATRLDDKTIIKTCRELADWGFVVRHVVSGRATEYVPAWATTKPYPMSASGDFATSENTSGDFTGGASGIFTGGAAQTSPVFSRESYLLLPADSKTDGNSNVSASASGVAMPASPSGAGSKAPGDDFERVWKAYGKLGNKQASKRAFATLQNPDVEHIAERAASWAASAKGKRMPLEKWLAEERYDEADRRAAKPHASDHDDEEGDDMAKTTRADRHRAEIDAAKRADALAEQKRRESIRCQVPFGTTFVANASEFVQEDGTSRLILHTSHGEVSVILESPNSELQDAGQRHLSQLTTAAGLGEIDDSAELHGIPIVWTKKGFASAREVAA
ncbi:hypothetical protein [uncultured Bradyrhizobium sp.]|uniref:hypothetical protein n=1 Tax=Bradyrhizobium sp. TaxID=376 RepID=UPI00260F1E87|nr:hypothetical protein [uncultured Bradyrhizobium sp.]